MPNEETEKEELSPKEEEYRQHINDIKEIVEMRGGAGKRFFRWIMGRGGVYRCAYRGNAETNFILGRQSVAMEIIGDLEQAVSKKDRADILL